ncbi:Pentatricopeptide repeat-containing protein [Cocos nucifera]|uniref:Pentatricopeptide repeat-containing protein n=1 Tax=Cocos nucifera TaxID=13894 RepID=A0A8K0I6Q4_COCNU|nr:Pentatricopeptide repeat-containing protein [Cocos nucifera]
MESGLSASIQTLNPFLSFLLKTRNLRLLRQLFSQISSNSISIDPQTHSLIAQALLKSHRFKEAEQLLSHAKNLAFLPRKRLWSSLILGVCVEEGDPDGALSLLQKCVRNGGICPSSNTFRALVASFSSRGMMERAFEVLDVMTDEKNGCQLDNFVCSSIISGFSKIGEPELGLRFYQRLEKVDGFQPNLITYTAAVDASCREGKIDKASDLIREMEQKGGILDAVLYSSWVCGYLRKGFLMEGLRKHRLMLEKGIMPDVVSYTNIIDGLCEEGNVEKVFGLLNKMAKSGIEPNVVTYTMVIQGFCKRNKLKEAFCVLTKLEELGIEVDEFVYSVLIDGLCQKGDLDGVFALLEEMQRKGVEVGSVTYNTVINGLCKAGKTSKADELSKGFVSDNFTYSALLHGYVKEKNVAGVMGIKRRLEEAGICMDVVTCNILVKALFMAGMVNAACELFEEMPDIGLAANSVTYCTMVDGYCKQGMIDKALEVFDVYRRTSSFAGAASHNCIIKGLCKEHMLDMAVKVFLDLTDRNLSPDSVTYKMLIRAHFREGNGEGVLKFIQGVEILDPELLSSICNDSVAILCSKGSLAAAVNVYMLARGRRLVIMSKSYYKLLKGLLHDGDKQIFQLIMNDCIKDHGTFEPRIVNILSLYLCKRNVQESIQFLNDISNKNISVSVITAVVDALKKQGRIQDAHNFLMEAEENGASLDVVVYSIVVDGLCKAGYLEKALDLCARMRKKGINPNIIIYNSVINGLCQQGCLVEAFRLFDSLEHNSVLPTIITYATLIAALSKEGFLQDANQLFDKMVHQGITPNTWIYNLLISGYCRFALIEEALEVLSDLEGSCLQPDAYTISAVISGCCLRGDIEGALGFFSEYRKRGFSPDFLGFLNLIRGLFAKGRMEEARSILRNMLQCADVKNLINRAGDELQVESLVSLLFLACDQGRIQEVIAVLSEVGSMIFPSWGPDSENRQLKKLHESGNLDNDAEIRGGIYPVVIKVPGNLYVKSKPKYMIGGMVDMSRGSCKEVDKAINISKNAESTVFLQCVQSILNMLLHLIVHGGETLQLSVKLYRSLDSLTQILHFTLPFPMLEYPFYLWSPGKRGSHFHPDNDLFVPNERM